MYSPDFAQWKWDVLPGKTITAPSGRIRLKIVGVEFVALVDVEDAGNDCVDAILRVPVRHQLHAAPHSDPDRVLEKDASSSRGVQPPALGRVIELPQVGGLHHRYERRAA
jgi:hypothetical protein